MSLYGVRARPPRFHIANHWFKANYEGKKPHRKRMSWLEKSWTANWFANMSRRGWSRCRIPRWRSSWAHLKRLKSTKPPRLYRKRGSQPWGSRHQKGWTWMEVKANQFHMIAMCSWSFLGSVLAFIEQAWVVSMLRRQTKFNQLGRNERLRTSWTASNKSNASRSWSYPSWLNSSKMFTFSSDTPTTTKSGRKGRWCR